MKKDKNLMLFIILFSFVFIGMVYAILQANLQINGIAKISENQWNVHFDNVVVNPDSVSIGTGDTAATIDPNNPLKVDFSVTLSLPGDFYEFTVDVENEGSIDAMIGTLTKTLKVNNVEAETVPEYLNYLVTYDDGGEILEKHLLEKNSFVTYKIRVEFKTDIDEEDLPDATTLSMSVESTYVQADDTAIKKKPFYACTYNGELIDGAEYVNGQYTYRYMQDQDGWRVILTDSSSTDPVTTRLCTSINEKPIVSMYGMFSGSKTTSIDTSSFDTSKVTNMSGMFANCINLTNIDVESFDTSSVVNMSSMFQNCSNLEGLNLGSFDTSNVLYMPGMFQNCSNIENINLDNFDTKNVLSMTMMFANCTSLESINLESFDTSKVTNMSAMFIGDSNLISINLKTFNTENVTAMTSMFQECSSLTELDLSGFDLRKLSSFPNSIFKDTSSLKKLNLSNIKLPPNMSDAIFRNSGLSSSPIEEIDVTGWDLSRTTNASGMLAAYGEDGLGGKGLKRIIGLNTWDTSHITNMSEMFFGLSSVTSLDLSTFNTSNVTKMDAMFNNCSSLTDVNVSNWNTSNVTSMHNMFTNCSSLTELNLSGFDLSGVSSFASIAGAIFSDTTSLKKLNLSNMKCPADMSNSIFRNGGLISSPIEEIDVTGWDLSLTTNATGMFGSNGINGKGGSGLKRIIGLNTLDTSHITNMSSMFADLSSLTELDLSSFDMTNVTNTDNMFLDCTSVDAAYGRTSADVTKLNASSNKPSNITFVVKS